MPGGVEPSRRIRRQCRRRRREPGRQRHGGAPRGGLPVAREGPRLASVASRVTRATKVQGWTPPGAPPSLERAGCDEGANRRRRRNPRAATHPGRKKRELFEKVKMARRQREIGQWFARVDASTATHSGPLAPRARSDVPAGQETRVLWGSWLGPTHRNPSSALILRSAHAVQAQQARFLDVRVSKDGAATDLGFTRDRRYRARKSAITDLRCPSCFETPLAQTASALRGSSA
jgi:hypothetical protein